MTLFCDVAVGIVLAGGQGHRLGLGRPKAWATTPQGGTLLDVALSIALGPIHRAVVAAPAGMELPPFRVPPSRSPACTYEAFRVDDLPGGQGPMAGLVPSLEWAQAQGAGWALVIAVDLPAVRTRDILHLWKAGEEEATSIAVVPRGTAGIEPLCSLLRPAAMSPVFRAAWEAGERSPRRVLECLPAPALVTVDTNDAVAWPSGPGALRSVNTPEDWARVLGPAASSPPP